jgi:hypothetical protein
MVNLYDVASGQPCGTITEEHLRFMMAQLEEESQEDNDYYLNAATLDLFEAQGADPTLLETLRNALGSREDMDLRWERA